MPPAAPGGTEMGGPAGAATLFTLHCTVMEGYVASPPAKGWGGSGTRPEVGNVRGNGVDELPGRADLHRRGDGKPREVAGHDAVLDGVDRGLFERFGERRHFRRAIKLSPASGGRRSRRKSTPWNWRRSSPPLGACSSDAGPFRGQPRTPWGRPEKRGPTSSSQGCRMRRRPYRKRRRRRNSCRPTACRLPNA